ncbi:hypothetical protein ACQFYA_11655 [Promicromonospora sp. Marseille-Q5078]
MSNPDERSRGAPAATANPAHGPQVTGDAVLSTPVTKVTVPHLGAQIIPRARLMSRLDEIAVDRPVTLVAAPAGFGKTSVLAQWCHHTGTTVGWLTVDEFDSDPHRFFRHVVAALQVATHGTGRPDAGPLLDIADRGPTGRPPEAAGRPDHHDELLPGCSVRTPMRSSTTSTRASPTTMSSLMPLRPRAPRAA